LKRIPWGASEHIYVINLNHIHSTSFIFNSVVCSEKGYTNGEIGVEWIKDFDKQTRHTAPNGETRLLIVDGHNSHYTADLLQYAMDNNIIILAYPPHCTHALQGQDVVIFSTFKNYYTTDFQDWERVTGERVTKANFLTIIEKSFRKTFIPTTILSAWRATGLIPFNPSVITPEQMVPAQPTAITGGLPFSQPSPVKAICAAWFSSPV
jgi:hypothetical protein